MRLRRIVPAVLALAAVLGAACGGASGSSNTPTPAPRVATPTPEAPDLTVFRNFIYPIEGACLPAGDQLMPNAAREYRSGVHEGLDFYQYDNCAKIEKGTAVRAAKDGVVIRADTAYHPLTQAELDGSNTRIAEGFPNEFAVLDLFRGRQVWIDHGKGIVTRYAHLSAIDPGITVGTRVVQGETIAFVGDSGTPESLSNPDTENHLHFELRTGDTFLGQGLPPEEVRELYTRLFEPFP